MIRKFSKFILSSVLAVSMFSVTAAAAPSEYLTHGAIPVWDYHLTNYDSEGNVRINPNKTTFSLGNNGSTVESAIPKMESQAADLGADVIISCQLETTENKDWYQNITKVAIIPATGNPNSGASISYDLSDDSIVLPGGQQALSYNQKYTLRITSNGYQSAYMNIHVVQAEAPTLLLNYPANPKVGEDIRFELENFNYAITNPINYVTLYNESTGVELTLTELASYHVVSNLITIYSSDAYSQKDIMPNAGTYRLRVYAEGFRVAEKKFQVLENASIAKASTGDFDTVTAASGGSSGGGGVTTGANLIFDHDLLANALILGELGLGTKDSKAIVNRWELEITAVDAVLNDDGTKIYSWIHYLNAFSDAKLNGQYLTFEDYMTSDNAVVYVNSPYNIKRVLEDNLLGETQSYLDATGKKAPALTVEKFVYGEDIEISCEDADYLLSITDIIVNSNYAPLKKELYQITEDLLIIDSSALERGESTLEFLSKGYQKTGIKIDYNQELDDITLTLERNDYKVGDNVVIQGLTDDFIANFKGAKLDNRNLLTQSEGGSSGNDWYTIVGSAIVLQGGLFKEAKDYRFEIEAEYYNKKSLTISIGEKETDPNENGDDGDDDLIDPFKPSSVQHSSILYSYYQIGFDYMSGLDAYLKSITGVEVNGSDFQPGLGFTTDDGYYSVQSVDRDLKIGTAGLNLSEDITVVVFAKGYHDLTFTITSDNELVFPDPEPGENGGNEGNGGSAELLDPPAGAIKAPGMFSDYYELSFGYSEHIYVKAVTEVSVNGTVYEKTSMIMGDSTGLYVVRESDGLIQIGDGGIKESGTYEITIKVDGYKEFKQMITIE